MAPAAVHRRLTAEVTDFQRVSSRVSGGRQEHFGGVYTIILPLSLPRVCSGVIWSCLDFSPSLQVYN